MITADPTAAPSDSRPIDNALDYVVDRLDRVEHMLGVLQATIQRTGDRLEPVLTSGRFEGDPTMPTDLETAQPTAEDRRSAIARRISGHAERADRLAGIVRTLDNDLEAILDALEV